MGTIIHHAVVATTWNDETFAKILKWVKNLPAQERAMFLMSKPKMNGYATVILVPDGSKEGWAESDWGDQLRREFIHILELDKYGDGSSPWDWVEIEFGESGQHIVDGNCERVI